MFVPRRVFGELRRLHDEMNQTFGRGNFFRAADPNNSHTFPALNVWDDGEHIRAEAELPGIDQASLEIFVTDRNQLTIKGQRQPNVPENAKWHHRERGFGEFTRTIRLPVAVAEDQVTASFAHGVLKITLPKAAEV